MTKKQKLALSAPVVAEEMLKSSADGERRYREIEAQTLVAHTMRLLRVRADISQEELGDRIGRKQSFVARLEAGGYDRCTISTLRTILRALGHDFNLAMLTMPLAEPIYSGTSGSYGIENEHIAKKFPHLHLLAWSGERLDEGLLKSWKAKSAA